MSPGSNFGSGEACSKVKKEELFVVQVVDNTIVMDP